MASKFGFSNLAKQFTSKIEKPFFDGAMDLAKQEFKSNFATESNSETNNPWNDVVRNTGDPILDVTGKLKSESTRTGGIIYGVKKATFNINPVDKRGREYAQYHQDGINQYKSKDEFQREFVTQSDKLTDDQMKLLEKLANNFF